MNRLQLRDRLRPEYEVIMIDPPWPERGSGKSKRGADRWYPVITRREEILRVIVTSPVWNPAENAHCYLWVTDNYLPWGLWILDGLGFTYKCSVPWIKAGRAGLGQWFRKRHEHLLFGTRGTKFAGLRTSARDLVGLIEAPRQAHSVKPDESFELVQARSLGRRLELFGRSPRLGWDVWGNELGARHDCVARSAFETPATFQFPGRPAVEISA